MTKLIGVEPSAYEQAAQHGVWQEAMMEKYTSIMKKQVVSSRWIYKFKHATNGSMEKYKARFVAKGFAHKEGVN